LLSQVRYPHEFAAAGRRAMARGVALCVGTVALLAVPLLGGLWYAGALGAAGVLMAAAHAVLAGAYFTGFLQAGQGRYVALCLALVAAAGLHIAGGAAVGSGGDPLLDTGLFLGSAVLLQVLCAVLLARATARVWGFR
ncbi:MAG TPA: hypothetical protein VES42_05625, partial [Pilimelia sp.]|nr:hypothetical protein [Pilimelia sp.]